MAYKGNCSRYKRKGNDRGETIKRQCCNCRDIFIAESRFIRTCMTCKAMFRKHNTTYQTRF